MRNAFLLALALTMTGCFSTIDDSSGGQPDASGTLDGGDGGRSPDGGSQADAGPDAGPGGAPSCGVLEDCPYWYCECETGPPVNTRHCTNGVCENAAEACPSSCRKFGTCWLGYASGGWDGGTNAGRNDCRGTPDGGSPDAGGPVGCGDDSNFTDIGQGCGAGTDCQSILCYGQQNIASVCTKRCASAENCPEQWKCLPGGNGFQVCMLGTTTTSPLSANASCAQASFSDIGQSCSRHIDCQSLMCNNGGYCTRRCETSAVCNGLSCQEINNGLLKACVR